VTRLILISLLLLLIAWGFWKVVDGIIESFGGLPSARSKKTPMKLVRDPVCGTWVSPHKSLGLRVEGTTHYFCSDQCRDHFRKSR
jgi:YHS domain-containing protein